MIKKILRLLSLSVLILCTTSLTVTTLAKDDKPELSETEIYKVSKLLQIEDLSKRKEELKNELKQNNSEKFKEFISTKIVVDEKIEMNLETKIPSKYENKVKNYGCWDYTGSKIGIALYGNWLFKFSLRTNHCADYKKIYSGFVRSTWAEIYSVGWGYYGETGDRRFDYIDYQRVEYIASRQGLFKLCVNSNWSCVQESRLWVENHGVKENGYNYFY